MREALGIVLLIVQFALVAPLVLRLLRTRDGAGISMGSEAIWSFAGMGWFLYGLGISSPTLMASGAMASLGSITMTSLLWSGKTAAERKSALLLAGLTLTTLGSSMLIAGNAGLSLSLSVIGAVQFLPQMAETWRTWRARVPTPGVSLAGTGLRVVYTGGWAIWAGAWFWWGIGFEHIDWPLVAWGLAGVIAFGMQILVAATGREHTAVARSDFAGDPA